MSEIVEEPAITVQMELKLRVKDIRNLLCTAFEQPNSSFEITGHFGPDKKLPDERGESWPSYCSYPVQKDSGILLKDAYGDSHEEHRLDLATIIRGIKVCAEKQPHTWKRIFLNDDYDCDDADVLLQCAVFGEAVYG